MDLDTERFFLRKTDIYIYVRNISTFYKFLNDIPPKPEKYNIKITFNSITILLPMILFLADIKITKTDLERYTRETHFFEYENISKIRLKNVNVCKKGGERKLKSEEEKLPGTTCCWDKEGYFRFPKRTSTLSLSRLPMETSGRTC